jgi:hypothetical protein
MLVATAAAVPPVVAACTIQLRGDRDGPPLIVGIPGNQSAWRRTRTLPEGHLRAGGRTPGVPSDLGGEPPSLPGIKETPALLPSMLNEAARHRRWRSPRSRTRPPGRATHLQHRKRVTRWVYRRHGSDSGDLYPYISTQALVAGSEVAFLATRLTAIDITLAALFWAWGH